MFYPPLQGGIEGGNAGGSAKIQLVYTIALVTGEEYGELESCSHPLARYGAKSKILKIQIGDGPDATRRNQFGIFCQCPFDITWGTRLQVGTALSQRFIRNM